MTHDDEPRDERLDEAARALREVRHGRSGQAGATRAAILRSHDARTRRTFVLQAVAAVLVLGLGLPTAWAWATGRLPRWGSEGSDAPAVPLRSDAPAVAPRPPIEAPIEAPIETPIEAPVEPIEAPVAPLDPIPAVAPTGPSPVPAPSIADGDEDASELEDPSAPPVDPAERRAYRAAHALHFDARDPSGALAAWDAYLSRYPSGRFAIEARYNRALCLVRLGREAEAREALAPFASGRYGAYRQREATALTEAMTP